MVDCWYSDGFMHVWGMNPSMVILQTGFTFHQTLWNRMQSLPQSRNENSSLVSFPNSLCRSGNGTINTPNRPRNISRTSVLQLFCCSCCSVLRVAVVVLFCVSQLLLFRAVCPQDVDRDSQVSCMASLLFVRSEFSVDKVTPLYKAAPSNQL